MNKKKSQPVNKEAFRMLAVEIGLNAACRKLGLPIPTGKSWARRGGWKLPKRPGGRSQRTIEASSLHPIADALVETQKELEGRTKTALARVVAASAEQAADQPLPVQSVAALRDLVQAGAKLFGWDLVARGPSVSVSGDKVLVVCDESRRQELIEQRERLLEAESQGKTIEVNGHKAKAAAPAALPAPETQSDANVGSVDSIVGERPNPVAKKDPVIQWMDSVGKAESWKTAKGSEPENQAGTT
jgi:hypothetical protein